MSDIKVVPLGTDQEQATFSDVRRHYDIADADLRTRIIDFDKRDILFRSHIEEKNWPYRAMIFDPRTFTAVYEKTARTFANKPRGRLIPREGADVLKAHINNELLMFQWDDVQRLEGETMLQKWMSLDLNARKYGAGFALAKWKYVRRTKKVGEEKGKVKGEASVYFDGPDLEALDNRDCLPNPSYSTVQKWFQHRKYLTLDELKNTNDAARSKPIYKNLDILEQQLKLNKDSSGGGDTRASNYVIKNKAIKGLTDTLGTDPSFKTVEVVTEYREDRWITFTPKHGIVLRDIPNPYDHGQIPVIQLKYYPIDDDIYGLSEIEPVEKIQRALNALICQYIDGINLSLYPIMKVNSTGGAVQMHTLEFGPGKKWLMQNPATDVIFDQHSPAGVGQFVSTYRFLVGAMQEGLGETSAVASNLLPGSGDKTATEVKDLAVSRSARDNFNQLLLAEAMKRQMMFWLLMNQQFLFSDKKDEQKIIQIIGKEALKFFQEAGLDKMHINDEGIDALSSPEMEDTSVKASDLETPLFPISSSEGPIPKLQMDEMGQIGSLSVVKEDLSGVYDYIPDVASMSAGYNQEERDAKHQAISLLSGVDPKTGQPTGISAMLQQEGYKVKIKDILIDYLEDIGFKNADQYIEKAEPTGGQNAGGQELTNQGGAGGPVQGGGPGPNGGNGGIPGGIQATLGGEAQGVVPGPVQVPA